MPSLKISHNKNNTKTTMRTKRATAEMLNSWESHTETKIQYRSKTKQLNYLY